MENLAEETQDYLEQQLKVYEKLQLLFSEEKKQLVDMDVDGLWESVAQKKKLYHELERLSIELKCFLDSKNMAIGKDVETLSLSDLIFKLPVSKKTKSKLKRLKKGLEICKESVFVAAAANKRYVQDSLTVVNDIISHTIQTVGQEQYSQSGRLLDSSDTTKLINTEV